MMNKRAAAILLEKYENGNVTAAELAILQQWYVQQAINNRTAFDSDTEKAMLDEIWVKVSARTQQVPKRRRLWPRAAGIAAAVAAIIGGIWLFSPSAFIPDKSRAEFSQQITPGKNGATLTLASGKKIKLSGVSNGRLAEEAGVEISKTEEGQVVYEIKGRHVDEDKINTLSTDRGETYIVTLPDKSRVWLNAASSLTYNTSLGKPGSGQRLVSLSGEAYFEVAKDKTLPFIVKTALQEVEVLGTHFNVSSYKEDQETRTTLLEGLVKISESKSHRSSLLKPGQQGISDGNGETRLVNADLEEAVAWKNGFFRFSEEPLLRVMDKLSRWYSFEVSYEGGMERYSEFTFGGFVPRSTPALALLKVMEKTGKVRFEVSGKKVLVKMKTQ